MKHLRVTLLFLLMGVMVNIAVAWGCSIWGLVERGELWDIKGEPDLDMVQRVPPGWIKPRLWGGSMMRDPYLIDARRSGFGVTEKLIASTFGHPIDYVLHVQDAGWPFRALTCYGEFAQTDKTRYVRLEGNMIPLLVNPSWKSGIRAPFWVKPNSQIRNWFPSYEYPLPCKPLWIGFAINTIFYAPILWILISTPFAVRRVFRRKRGLCVKCAYDLRGAEHEFCPECGHTC